MINPVTWAVRAFMTGGIKELVYETRIIHYSRSERRCKKSKVGWIAKNARKELRAKKKIHLAAVLLVYQHHLHVVFSFAQAAVKSHTVEPQRQVGFVNATFQHALKVDRKVESDTVSIVGIDDNYILTCLHFRLFVVQMYNNLSYYPNFTDSCKYALNLFLKYIIFVSGIE